MTARATIPSDLFPQLPSPPPLPSLPPLTSALAFNATPPSPVYSENPRRTESP